MFEWLRKLWWGQYSLAIAFWAFGVGGTFGGVLLAMLVYMLFFIADFRGPGAIVFAIVFWGYAVIVGMGIWRSANGYRGTQTWPILAKAVVVLYAGLVVYRLINGGFKAWLQLATS